MEKNQGSVPDIPDQVSDPVAGRAEQGDVTVTEGQDGGAEGELPCPMSYSAAVWSQPESPTVVNSQCIKRKTKSKALDTKVKKSTFHELMEATPKVTDSEESDSSISDVALESDLEKSDSQPTFEKKRPG